MNIRCPTTSRFAAATVLLALFLLFAPAILAEAIPPHARVTATDRLVVRECATLHCPIVARVSLGAELEITGGIENGFLPVRIGSVEGFAYELYLDAGNGAPWFVEGTSSCRQVAIIFNIGIGYEPSQEILDTLLRTQTPATMFPMGWWALAFPDYLRQLDTAGYQIGTHGDQPLFLTGESSETVAEDIRASKRAIESVMGREIDEYFTPYAADSNDRVRSIAAGEGLLPVGWNVSANDYGPDATEQEVYQRVMNSVYPGAVVEMHLDGPATAESTALALPTIIEELRAQGYELVTIPDLVIPCDGITNS